MSLLRHTSTSQNNNWGYPLYLCDCCPYGYHIDLDFVQYCESISREADNTETIKRRRDRRRQRKSIEVLLGLNSIEQFNAKLPQPISPIIEAEHHQTQRERETFDNIFDDFETSFQKSQHQLSNNLPDVTAVSNGGTNKMSSRTTTDFPGNSITRKFVQRKHEEANECASSNPSAFKNIREQMALSLERTKQLEEEIKQIPALKVKISTLEDENRQLLKKLELNDKRDLDSPKRFNYYSEIDRHSTNEPFRRADVVSTKDVGVTCSVLTRNVGVGHQTPNRRNAATETTGEWEYADKWFGEKLKFIESQHERIAAPLDTCPAPLSKENKSIMKIDIGNIQHQTTQTVEALPLKKIFRSKQTQTLNQSVTQKSQSILVKPSMNDFTAQKSCKIDVDDSLTDINCHTCNHTKISDEFNTTTNMDQPCAISLASLNFSTNKPLNVGTDSVTLSLKNRSTSTQYNYKPECFSKSSQYESSTVSTFSQYNIKIHSKSTQCELRLRDISTQSDESSLGFDTKKHEVEVKEKTEATTSSKSIGTITTPELIVCRKCETNELKGESQASDDFLKEKKTTSTEKSKREETKKREELSVSLSRIPRLSGTPTMERRSFRRQDTYTKISTPPSEKNNEGISASVFSSIGLSTTGSSYDIDEVTNSMDIQEHNEVAQPDISATANPITIPPILIVSNASTLKHRAKSIPSREMLGAMKVLNDSLQKGTKLPSDCKAIDIIQQEWFKVSGLVNANPLEVEDYLDAFEDMSSLLLDYIVNMTDTSGNTAMHYAVSHGNFDVVSILLDSKVCDINKPNKAGYTSLMLVSLSEIHSQTHANVVKRLFHMADVNIRAKQHGQTALMLAVSHGRLDMVKMLLEAGADINIQDDDGSTALMCAAEHGHIEIVKHFLNHPDCDSTITDVDGSTALKIAMEAEHRPIGVLLYAHERNLMVAQGHKYKKKPSSPKASSNSTQSQCLKRHEKLQIK